MDEVAFLASPLRDCVIKDIKFGKQIGRGANGRILECKWAGITVAVKEIHSIFVNEVSDPEFQSFKRSFLRECEQSSQLSHPNIVRFFGIYWPPGATVPSLVMERLHCSLTSLLEQNPVFWIKTKLSIIHDVALGLRYLHSHIPPIIHRDLSSNNILISKAMEGKIGDLGTARLVDPTRQSQMTKAPGTVDFMPPKALAAGENVRYERELDVFSFGCVMLHTLSHQWPTPSEPVITDPVTFEVKGRTEVERRCGYFDTIDGSKAEVLIPLIKSCLSNLPKNRTSIERVCDQLEDLVDRENVSTDDIINISALQQELGKMDVEIQRRDAQIQERDALIQRQTTELHNKDAEIKMLHSEVSRLKLNISQVDLPAKQVHCSYSYIVRLPNSLFCLLCRLLLIFGTSNYHGNNVLPYQRSVGLPLLLN